MVSIGKYKRMAANITANVFEMMSDLDELKDVIPEGLYLNFSNLLKAEYGRQQHRSPAQPIINNITYNIQTMNINVPASVQQPEQVPDEPEDEAEQVWRVYELNDNGIWSHLLLDENGQYNEDLQGDYDTVEINMQSVIHEYSSNLTLEDAKYYVERSGLASTLSLYRDEYEGHYGRLDDSDDQRFYQQLVYAVISNALMVHHEPPARVVF